MAKLNGEYSGAGITVGVIDDGVEYAHPDLVNQIDLVVWMRSTRLKMVATSTCDIVPFRSIATARQLPELSPPKKAI